MEFLSAEPRPLGSEFLSGRSRNSTGRTGEGRPGEESRKNRAICGMGRGGIAQRAKKEASLSASLICLACSILAKHIRQAQTHIKVIYALACLVKGIQEKLHVCASA